MFGYVTLYRKGLADAEMDRYQAYYCGLCQTLGRRYGRTGQLALSYDMAFVAILLTALYDTPTAFSEGRCVPHQLKKRPRADNELLDYAADMTAALAYYNFLDDWQDDHRRTSLVQAQKLEPSLPALRERWPRQLQTMAAQLDRLNALESAGSHDLDALCNAFGALLGEVFACPMPHPSRIRPTARISEKMNVERFSTTTSGSSAANVGKAKIMPHTMTAYSANKLREIFTDFLL